MQCCQADYVRIEEMLSGSLRKHLFSGDTLSPRICDSSRDQRAQINEQLVTVPSHVG